MKIGTKRLVDEQQTSELGMRFSAHVNGKQQGIIVGVRDPAKGFSHWIVEGDAYNKSYPDSKEAIFAAAEKNGRKISPKDKENARVEKIK